MEVPYINNNLQKIHQTAIKVTEKTMINKREKAIIINMNDIKLLLRNKIKGESGQRCKVRSNHSI